MSRFDDFIDNLQEQIFEEARQAYGEEGFDRWRNPRHQGRIASPDAKSRVTGQCGDTMEIYLNFKAGRVKEATYYTDGCASSAICGSFAAEMTLGKTPEELADITGETVLAKVGRLPAGDHHCTTLAAGAVREALTDYMQKLTGR